jgi:putative inorganic carbon (HCO3(-)) transporter
MALDTQPMETVTVSGGRQFGSDRVTLIFSAFLAGLAFVLPISIALSNVMWGGALLMGLWLWAKNKFRVNWTGVELPWILFLSAGIVAAAGADNPARAIRSLRGEILAAIFLLAAHGVGDGWKQLRLFSAGAIIAAVWGLVQKGVGLEGPLSSPWLGRLISLKSGRSPGFYSHPITFAEMLLLAGAVILGLGLAGRMRRWVPALAAVSAAALLSQTRGVWLAMGFLLLAWTVLRRDHRVAKVLGILVVGLGLVFVLSSDLRHRVASISDTKTDLSNRIRMGLWEKSVESIRDHPVVGVGPGHFRVKGADLRYSHEYEPERVWTETHNVYLQVAVERGVVGLGLFILFLSSVGRLLWSVARIQPALWGLFFGFLGLLVAGMTESWFNDSEILMCLFFLVGTAWRLSHTPTNEVT